MVECHALFTFPLFPFRKWVPTRVGCLELRTPYDTGPTTSPLAANVIHYETVSFVRRALYIGGGTERRTAPQSLMFYYYIFGGSFALPPTVLC